MKKMFAVVFSAFFLVAEMQTAGTRSIDFNFQQNDYKLDFQRAELTHYNKQLLNHIELHSFKYNRTCAALNITKTYKIDLDNDLEIIAQAYKFMSNEYRYFPIRFQVNYCSAVTQNIAGMGRFTECGTFKGCPIKKDVRYHTCNFTPDPLQFPPLIPDGEYMVEFQGLYHSVEVWVVRGYAKIFRPIAIP